MVSMVMPFGWVGAITGRSPRQIPPGTTPFLTSPSGSWMMGWCLSPWWGTESFTLWPVSMKRCVLFAAPKGSTSKRWLKKATPQHDSCCGVSTYMDFDLLEVTLPEPKRIKAKYLLGEPALQRVHIRPDQTSEGAGRVRSVLGCGVPGIAPASLHFVCSFARSPRKTGAEDVDSEVAWTEFWDPRLCPSSARAPHLQVGFPKAPADSGALSPSRY